MSCNFLLGGSWDLVDSYNWGYNPTYNIPVFVVTKSHEPSSCITSTPLWIVCEVGVHSRFVFCSRLMAQLESERLDFEQHAKT